VGKRQDGGRSEVEPGPGSPAKLGSFSLEGQALLKDVTSAPGVSADHQCRPAAVCLQLVRFTHGHFLVGSRVSDASDLGTSSVVRQLSEFRDELFRLRAETPESPGEYGFLLRGRGCPCSRQARDDAVLVPRPPGDLDEGLGDYPAELIGTFRGRLKRRYQQRYGGRGGSAEDSQRPGGLGLSEFTPIIRSLPGRDPRDRGIRVRYRSRFTRTLQDLTEKFDGSR
jgi:hypothetical protein